VLAGRIVLRVSSARGHKRYCTLGARAAREEQTTLPEHVLIPCERAKLIIIRTTRLRLVV
jgi:hypothetical protein